MEILAPVGGQEQLVAAVRCGADAVYLGTKGFNARRRADNFEEQGLREAVAYCHGRGVRVHVTVNTLVTDAELPALSDTVREVAGSGADAVILQDLAAAALFRDMVPDLPRHASTQMTVHNLEGALRMKEMGFSRIVLARELTGDEVRKIHDSADIELECFIHGALCMSTSGQCLLSAFLGDRSGNRGMCAQPCRLDFRAGERGYALSLKDVCLIPRIREMRAAGVCALKIEGRLRRPEYVAAAVDACRRAEDGAEPDIKRLERVFSRGGFTDGYWTGRRDLDMFGVRSEADKQESGAVAGEIAGLYRRENSRVPVDMSLTVRTGEKAKLTVTDGANRVVVEGDVPEAVRSMRADWRDGLEKTGGTPFVLRELRADCEEGLTVRLNPLRREALERLLKERETVRPWSVEKAPSMPRGGVRNAYPKLRLRFEKRSQMFDCPQAEKVYLPLEETRAEDISELGDRLIIETPRLVYPGKEAEIERRLKELRAYGAETVCAGNPGTVRMAGKLGFKVSGGHDLNVMNSLALREYKSQGVNETLLSPEINLRDAARLDAVMPLGIIAYGYLPLMLFRCCPVQGKKGCAACRGQSELHDRQGRTFRVLCHGKRYSSLLNAVPLYVGDQDIRGVDWLTAYFTVEDREACRDVAVCLLEGSPLSGERTRGPYFRKMR